MTDNLDIPEFLRLSPEQRRQGWIDNPPQPMVTTRHLTDVEREALAARRRKEIEQHNRGYEMRRKFEALPEEERKLRVAKAKLRKARRR